MRSRPGEIGARSLDLMRSWGVYARKKRIPAATVSDSLTHKCASKKFIGCGLSALGLAGEASRCSMPRRVRSGRSWTLHTRRPRRSSSCS
eukprot:2028692-Prymnesium_polylepis.1